MRNPFKTCKEVILYVIIDGINLSNSKGDRETETPLFKLKYGDRYLMNYYFSCDEDENLLSERKQYSMVLGPLGMNIIELLHSYYEI